MPAVAFALPLLPGKEEGDREALERFTQGDDREAYYASRRALGITREGVWHQQTPNGTLAVVLIEAEDIQRAFQGLGESTDPIDVAFRASVLDVHGIDLANDTAPEITPIADTRF